MTSIDDKLAVLDSAKRVQATIVKEITDIKNAGTLPKEITNALNAILRKVNELVKEINDKIYRQTTLGDFDNE
jgi:hypothetical protein|tara:strand:- start:195 stop:413 length:219 start_codon:yes stop_codon:yes gene_type:complete